MKTTVFSLRVHILIVKTGKLGGWQGTPTSLPRRGAVPSELNSYELSVRVSVHFPGSLLSQEEDRLRGLNPDTVRPVDNQDMPRQVLE
jgi:hypothetical protein